MQKIHGVFFQTHDFTQWWRIRMILHSNATTKAKCRRAMFTTLKIFFLWFCFMWSPNCFHIILPYVKLIKISMCDFHYTKIFPNETSLGEHQWNQKTLRYSSKGRKPDFEPEFGCRKFTAVFFQTHDFTQRWRILMILHSNATTKAKCRRAIFTTLKYFSYDFALCGAPIVFHMILPYVKLINISKRDFH